MKMELSVLRRLDLYRAWQWQIRHEGKFATIIFRQGQAFGGWCDGYGTPIGRDMVDKFFTWYRRGYFERYFEPDERRISDPPSMSI